MAYAEDAVLAKLSALNESHDSIATAAQWIMFHRRHSERTVQLWLQRLKESSSSKKLSLIYLANEVTQQSKARHKEDFVTAFSPVIAEATAAAYRGAPADIQNKLRRVVDVWRDRAIFEAPIMAAIESRIDELEKARGSTKPSFGSPTVPAASASSVPAELAAIATAQQNLSKCLLPAKTSTSTATQDYEKMVDPSTPIPAPPVYAARLNGLLKTLSNAESAVTDCVRARRELVAALEKVLATNRAVLASDEDHIAQLVSRKKEIEEKKANVENAIIRGLGSVDANSGGNGSVSPSDGPVGSVSPPQEPDRPEIEALTPPSVNSDDDDDNDRAPIPPSPPLPTAAPTASGIEMLSTLASQYQALPISTNGSNKRRRLDSGEDFPDLGGDDEIDADVAEMLRKG